MLQNYTGMNVRSFLFLYVLGTRYLVLSEAKLNWVCQGQEIKREGTLVFGQYYLLRCLYFMEQHVPLAGGVLNNERS